MNISQAIAAFSGVRTIASGIVAERDAIKLAELKTELLDRLMQAQSELLDLLGRSMEQADELRLSKGRVAELEREKTERERYRLVRFNTGAHTAYAFQLKPASELIERADEPPHLLCCVCLEAGRKSILQGGDYLGRWMWSCRICKDSIDGPTNLG